MADEDEIGFCGYNGGICVARSDDKEVRQKVVDGWKKFFGHEKHTVDNIKCSVLW